MRSGRRAVVLTSRTSRVGASSTSRVLSRVVVVEDQRSRPARSPLRPSRRKPPRARACCAARADRPVQDRRESHSFSITALQMGVEEGLRLLARRRPVDDDAAASAVDRLEARQDAGPRGAAPRRCRRPGPRPTRTSMRASLRASRSVSVGTRRCDTTALPTASTQGRRSVTRRSPSSTTQATRRRSSASGSTSITCVRHGHPSASATRKGTVPLSPGPLRQPSSSRSLRSTCRT